MNNKNIQEAAFKSTASQAAAEAGSSAPEILTAAVRAAIRANIPTNTRARTEHEHALIDITTLLEAGTDPNITTDCGYTLLQEAAAGASMQLLQLLFKHGARATLAAIREASHRTAHDESETDKLAIIALIVQQAQAQQNQ